VSILSVCFVCFTFAVWLVRYVCVCVCVCAYVRVCAQRHMQHFSFFWNIFYERTDEKQAQTLSPPHSLYLGRKHYRHFVILPNKKTFVCVRVSECVCTCVGETKRHSYSCIQCNSMRDITNNLRLINIRDMTHDSRLINTCAFFHNVLCVTSSWYFVA